MSDKLDIQDIQTLYGLRNALGRFASDTGFGLQSIATEITSAQEWLEERMRHWKHEVDRAQRNMDEASENLRRCHMSGYRDADGYYHQPDCSGESQAVRRAEEWVRQCVENFETVRAGQSRLSQAISDYQREARHLGNFIGNHTERAEAFLAQTAAKYEKVQTAQISIHPYRATPEILTNRESSVETEPVTTDPNIRDLDPTMQQEIEGKKPSPQEGWSPGGPERAG